MRPAYLTLMAIISFAIIFAGCTSSTPVGKADGSESAGSEFEVVRSDSEWQKILTPQQFYILREKGTERPFSGKYHDYKAKGIYVCTACQQDLFSSDAKYDSGTGWPSFWKPYSETSVMTRPDNGLFMHRTEVLCGRCGGHLGHVFDDGPLPTGLRYCINSVALDFMAK